jgi:hypothetical protein
LVTEQVASSSRNCSLCSNFTIEQRDRECRRPQARKNYEPSAGLSKASRLRSKVAEMWRASVLPQKKSRALLFERMARDHRDAVIALLAVQRDVAE